MIDFSFIKGCLRWRVVSAYLCTVAVSLSHHTLWRVPRDAFRFGALPYLLAYTAAMLLVGLPGTLLQLALGHLSQEDAVGVWRAVPFFKGIGYLRLATSYLVASYTVCYVALTSTFLLYSLGNSIPYQQCTEITIAEDNSTVNTYNASECLIETFLSAASDAPEYFTALALVQVAACFLFPFILFNPLQHIKKFFYFLSPVVIVLAVTVASATSSTSNIMSIGESKWESLTQPHVWMAAISQALLTCHIGGGYLIAVSDTIYTTTNVQWIALSFVGTNLLTSWLSVIFWYSIIDDVNKDTTMVAILVETYNMAANQNVGVIWALLLLVAILASGAITLISVWYPLCVRCWRSVGSRRRATSVALSLGVAATSLATLAGRLPALTQLDAVATPLMVMLPTAAEFLAFVFVYGWKTLVEDVEFVMSRGLNKCWLVAWMKTPFLIVAITAWWATAIIMEAAGWLEEPWHKISLLVTLALISLVFLTFAVTAMASQQEYDILSKLKSSFMPSRQWGPRDPITHYYWLARREESSQRNPRSGASGWRLGQLSGATTFFNISSTVTKLTFDPKMGGDKKRAYSDDWFWTKHRRTLLATKLQELVKQRRSRSLDWSRSGSNWKSLETNNIDERNKAEQTVEQKMDEITIDCSDKS